MRFVVTLHGIKSEDKTEVREWVAAVSEKLRELEGVGRVEVEVDARPGPGEQ